MFLWSQRSMIRMIGTTLQTLFFKIHLTIQRRLCRSCMMDELVENKSSAS